VSNAETFVHSCVTTVWPESHDAMAERIQVTTTAVNMAVNKHKQWQLVAERKATITQKDKLRNKNWSAYVTPVLSLPKGGSKHFFVFFQ